MQLNLRLSQKMLILVAIPLLFELVFVSNLYVLWRRSEAMVEQEAAAKSQVAAANDLITLAYDCGMTLIRYSLTRDESLGDHFRQVSWRMRDKVDFLKASAVNDLDELELAMRIEHVALRAMELQAQAKERVEQGSALVADDRGVLRDRLKALLDNLVIDVRQLTDYVSRQGHLDPQRVNQSRVLVDQWLLLGVAVNLILAVVVPVYFNRTTARRFDTLVDNTHRLARRDQLNPELTGNDELAQLDHVFHEMARSLKEVEEMKQQFVDMVSHDLRTPLTSLQSFLELLDDGIVGTLTDDGQRLLKGSMASTTRLMALINDLLDVEKLASGNMQMSFAPTLLDTVIERSVEAVESAARGQAVTVLRDESGLEVQADAHRLIQVFVNLLGNAIKFSPEGGIVKITTETQPGFVRVCVSDEGRGVPPSHREAIFERFRQVEMTDATVKGGTGLGLPICKAIIEQHGGKIGVDSEEGQGSTFWLTIPTGQKVQNQ